MRQSRPIGSHTIDAGDGSKCHDAFVGSLVAHATNGRYWEQDWKKPAKLSCEIRKASSSSKIRSVAARAESVRE